MATLRDVAQDAGVSIATVSCCLSGSKNVKPETKQKILDSIRKLKYIPNESARNLKSATTNRIGVVLTDIDNLYHAEIFKGISSCLQNHDYTVSVAFSDSSPDVERQKIDELISQNVAGLILITCQPTNQSFFADRILAYHIPTVFIERRPENLFVSFASFDNQRTALTITEQLLKKGYRNIAMITGNTDYSSERDSITGYCDAFSNQGLPVDRSLICSGSMSKESAFKLTLSSLSLDHIQAIITTSENMAQGVLEALHVLGLNVPDNLQLITFSEESWNASSRLPGVIHTSRTAFTLGQASAELLLKNLLSPMLFEPRNIVFEDKGVQAMSDVPTIDAIRPYHSHTALQQEALRILMVDLATSHSSQTLSRNFSRKTGIPLEFEYLPQNKMLEAIQQDIGHGNSRYDIFMYDVPWLEFMVQNSLLADVTELAEDPAFPKDSLFPENLRNCKYEDRFYGIPIVGGTQIMFYRKDLFENQDIIKSFKEKYRISLRPPKTWTEFNGIAEFFTRSCNPDSPTEYGTSFAGIIDEELAPEILIRLWSYGGTIWDSYNRACLNTPENEKAFESILTTLQYTPASPFQTSISQTVADFCNGRTAILLTYTEYAAKISQSIHSSIIGQVGYEILPGKTPMSIGWNFGLNPFSVKRKEAFLYFYWLCKHDISYYMTILDGQSPVAAPYHSQELLKLYPWMSITEQSFPYSRKRNGPYRPKALVIPQNKIEVILCSVLRMILLDHMTIREALEAGQAEMVALFKYYGYPKPLHFI